VPDRLVQLSMTLSDPNPGFKVTEYLKVEYLADGATIFRLDALALSVIATATWLAGRLTA